MRPSDREPSSPRLPSDQAGSYSAFAPPRTTAATSCAGCRRPVAAGSLIRWREMDRCPPCTLRALAAIPLPNRPAPLTAPSLRTTATQKPGRLHVW